MAFLSEIVQSLGGMAQKQQLVRRGVRDQELTRGVRSGDVIRVRNGWYSTIDEQSPELRAVRVGGRLTGISAIQARGGWVLGSYPLHVAVPANAARLRTQRNRHVKLNVKAPAGVVLHWVGEQQRCYGTAVAVGLIDALERVVLDEDFETAVATLDWAIHTGQLDVVDFETLILRLPLERRGIRYWVDGNCESLPESLARTRLRLSGHHVQSQHVMADGRRIDLVVDEIVAVEVDGEEFHLHQFEADRGKDVDITLMRLHAMRPSARMVFDDWARFERAVEVAIHARLHPDPVLVERYSVENSGFSRRPAFNFPGMTGWRRRPRRRNPEFSRERGRRGRRTTQFRNTDGGRGGYLLGE